MSEELELQHETNFSEGIEGNIIDLELKKCDREVRADIMVGSKDCIRVWGQVIDCECNPVRDALVNLLRSYTHHGKTEYEGVAYTVTDCCGFYQFDVCADEEHDKYKVVVSKAHCGKERVIRGDGICFPCID